MEDETEVFDHYLLYLNRIYNHFKKNNLPFEFRIFNYETELIEKINNAASSAEWQMQICGDLVIWKTI